MSDTPSRQTIEAMLVTMRGILRVCEANDPQAVQYARTAARSAIEKAEAAIATLPADCPEAPSRPGCAV